MNISDMWLQNRLTNPQGMQVPPSPMNPEILSKLSGPIQRQPGDPINTGASYAMGAAKKSEMGFGRNLLKSLSRGLENFGISGLRGSDVAHSRGIGSMLRTPDERDAIRAQEDAKRAHEQLQMLNFLSKESQRQHSMANKDAHLREQIRHHNLIAGRSVGRSQSGKNAHEIESIAGIDLSQYPEIKSGKERNEYASTLKGGNIAYKALDRIKGEFTNLENLTKGNLIAPMGSVVPFSRNIKDAIARTGISDSITKETILRKRLESQFARLEPVLDRGLKGSTPGEALLTRFHELEVFFNSGQPVALVKDRLEDLLEEIDDARKTASLSLKTGRHIDALPKAIEKADTSVKTGNSKNVEPIINRIEEIKRRMQQISQGAD